MTTTISQLFNWQVMGKYHFVNEDTLALSYYDRTRFPTLKERYTTSKPAYNQIAIVNPQLKPGTRSRGGFNLEWCLHARLGSVSVYYNRVSDAILSHNIDADTIQNQNSGTVDYSGLDAGIKGKISNILDVGLSYTLIHADAKRKDIGKITDLPTQTIVRMDDSQTVGAVKPNAVGRGAFPSCSG
ncbi:TonB-dependent receptor domain-containing protein [Escherichia coli]